MFKILPTTAQEFKVILLSECIKALKMNTFLDNFDKSRFNHDGVDRSMIFDTVDRVKWFSWFFDSYEKLFEAFMLFKSNRSKRLFLNLLAFRLAGHHSIRIETGFDEKSDRSKSYDSLESYVESTLPAVGIFGKLRHYDFTYNNRRYVADCLGFKDYLHRKQYFFCEDGVEIKPGCSDYVVDGGACLGDTAIVFGKAVGPEGKIFAFDPVEDHLEILRFNIRQNPDCQIQVMPFGLSNVDVDCTPIKLQAYTPGFSSFNQIVPLRSLDRLILDQEIPKVNFIKMDIEGAEMSAIAGASNTIRTFRPSLAISLYHKPNDIFEIPLYLAKEFPFYNMYLGHYTIHMEETVLYCSAGS